MTTLKEQLNVTPLVSQTPIQQSYVLQTRAEYDRTLLPLSRPGRKESRTAIAGHGSLCSRIREAVA